MTAATVKLVASVLGQNSLERTAGTGQPGEYLGQDSWERRSRAGKRDKTAETIGKGDLTGHPGKDREDRMART